MGLETGTYISDLDSANPTASDNVSQGDDHIRLIKATIQATFPNIDGAVTPTDTELNDVSDLSTQVPTYVAKTTASSVATVEVNSIPSWANKITLFLQQVSANGTANWLIQTGDASAWVTTGYRSQAAHLDDGQVNDLAAGTTGGRILVTAANEQFDGEIIIQRTESGGNEWTIMSQLNESIQGTNNMRVGSGIVSMSAALTRVRLNFNGDTGDNGNISARYER